MPTSGKSTTSFELAKLLPDWIFVDIWRIKDMFEPIGYSNGMKEDEFKILQNIAKEEIISLCKKIMSQTKRNIILQEGTKRYVNSKLGKVIRENNYELYTIQLTSPFDEALKRNRKRKKPDLKFFNEWDENLWNDKIQRKIQKGDIVVDTSKNSPSKAANIILKLIGEKPKKHPHTNKLRRFW